jgi:hypothetical protein
VICAGFLQEYGCNAIVPEAATPRLVGTPLGSTRESTTGEHEVKGRVYKGSKELARRGRGLEGTRSFG